jgi:predicted ArsR family transcriptional regulator
MSATPVPLQSVGRALARISALRGPRPGPDVAGGDSRAAILAFVERADDVVRVEDIAQAVGLHPNTVRGHLDALLASGRIVRIADQRATRGRPHWLYSATTSASVRELAAALDAELERASAPDVARLAAAAWAEAGPGVTAASTIDEAVDVATEALTGFGFDAVRNPVGDEITLRACPYAQLVHEHPVICDIHAALLGEVLGRTGQPVDLDRLDVFPRPGLCVAHLHRPDAEPEWVVDVAEGAPERARHPETPQAAASAVAPAASPEAPTAARTPRAKPTTRTGPPTRPGTATSPRKRS